MDWPGNAGRRSTVVPADLSSRAGSSPISTHAVARRGPAGQSCDCASSRSAAGNHRVVANAAGRDRRREHEYYDFRAVRGPGARLASDCNTDYARRSRPGARTVRRHPHPHRRRRADLRRRERRRGSALWRAAAPPPGARSRWATSGREGPRAAPTCEHVPFRHAGPRRAGLRTIAPFPRACAAPRWATRPIKAWRCLAVEPRFSRGTARVCPRRPRRFRRAMAAARDARLLMPECRFQSNAPRPKTRFTAT